MYGNRRTQVFCFLGGGLSVFLGIESLVALCWPPFPWRETLHAILAVLACVHLFALVYRIHQEHKHRYNLLFPDEDHRLPELEMINTVAMQHLSLPSETLWRPLCAVGIERSSRMMSESTLLLQASSLPLRSAPSPSLSSSSPSLRPIPTMTTNYQSADLLASALPSQKPSTVENHGIEPAQDFYENPAVGGLNLSLIYRVDYTQIYLRLMTTVLWITVAAVTVLFAVLGHFHITPLKQAHLLMWFIFEAIFFALCFCGGCLTALYCCLERWGGFDEIPET